MNFEDEIFKRVSVGPSGQELLLKNRDGRFRTLSHGRDRARRLAILGTTTKVFAINLAKFKRRFDIA